MEASSHYCKSKFKSTPFVCICRTTIFKPFMEMMKKNTTAAFAVCAKSSMISDVYT